MNPNIERARKNESHVLQAVGLVGWLTTAQVAAWVWPDSGKHSGRNRAAEVLGRLHDCGYLLRRQTALGAWAYLLTNTGAAQANEGLTFNVCRNGYDLSQLDVGKQELIVMHLVIQKSVFKMGPAGVRGAVRCNLVKDATLRHADALSWDPDLGEWVAAMVVRTQHPELVAKACRLRGAAGRLELLGHPGLVRQFEKAVSHHEAQRRNAP